jgi:anaerobic ribonucleoside-triphosphate reductase
MTKVPAEIYSRVSGYYRPVAQWNRAKQEEFKERRFYEPEKLADVSVVGKSD